MERRHSFNTILPLQPLIKPFCAELYALKRRMERAYEGLRYMDIVRWKLAGKVLKRPVYGMLDPNNLKTKVVDKNFWFFPKHACH